jgi:DNA repair exonuclease SbcCD ATPase subunit
MEEGFIDLRRNTVADSSEGGSFWPSFTDIMMVVVMIFMIGSTILVMRNWDLVRELRATLEAERKAEELARSATQTSATLEEQLASARRQLAELHRQLAQAEELNQSRTRQINRQEQRLLALQSEKTQLTDSLEQSRRAARLSEEQLTALREEQARLVESRTALEERLQKLREEYAQLEQSTAEQAAELAAARQQRSLSEQQLVSLQGEYDEIRIKYDKLVKPARSSSGKHVVSVRYWKEGEYYQLRLKDADDESFRPVTRTQLHEALSALKDKYAGDLYVRVIIPDDSGLSYSEAWNFTFDILEKYDYYHQDKPERDTAEQ